jgi:hypothetical protein
MDGSPTIQQLGNIPIFVDDRTIFLGHLWTHIPLFRTLLLVDDYP